MTRPPRALRGRTVALLGAIVLGVLLPCAVAAEPDGPRLVVVISVDQLRADRFDPGLPGGLGRIAREGRVFADAAHEHANTETCPGHAVILTGLHPGRAGVPMNDTVDRETGKSVYCVQDDAPDAQTLGPSGLAGQGRSPRRMRATTLGDWLREARPGARVFSVSGKDRAAITLGGQHPDGVYWYETTPPGGFTTSRYYAEALPDWVERWHGATADRDGFVSTLPDRWEHETGDPPNGARIDDTPWEVSRFLRVSGHPIRSGDRKQMLEQVSFSPWLDTLTLDFARTLLREEKLGTGPEPDLLAVGVSATDLVGHLYGPGSQEARDALLRLDRDLGRLLEDAEKQAGRGRVLLVLTADHGVVELPEFLAMVGASDCPVEGGRIDSKSLLARLDDHLRRRFDPSGAPEGAEPWMWQESLELSVNRRRAAERGIGVERVAEAAAAFLAAEPGIERVFTAAEMAKGEGPAPFARLYANSFDPERSGDLAVQTAPTCVLAPYPAGTSHGTPHLYDRAVPVAFLGPGIGKGVVRGRAAPVDIAPTLAGAIGIPVPPGLDGRALPLGGL